MIDEQKYLLVKLMEECAEVQHACAKAIAFGLDDVGPKNDLTNGEMIAFELADLTAVTRMLQLNGCIKTYNEEERIMTKMNKVGMWMKYSRKHKHLEEYTSPPCKKLRGVERA